MFASLLPWAFRRPWLILLLVIVVGGLGVWAFQNLKVEAYPDISSVTVVIITPYPGRAPEEVERQITIPIELAMGNCPQVETIRSRTIFGLSTIQVSFEEGTESYWARLRVQERLNNLNLPKEASPGLAPLTSSAGEILRYEVRSDGTQSIMDLRTLHDWVIMPKLLRVPGVGDVANFGGDLKYYLISVIPKELQRANITLSDLMDAVAKNNSTSGGSVINRGSMSFVVRGRGTVRNEQEIGAIFAKSIGGTPIYVRDVARVTVEAKVPTGVFGKDDRDHTIEGLVTIRKGENPGVVLEKVKEAIDALNHGGLPSGVYLDVFYDRGVLIDTTFHTVTHSVCLGIGLVVVVLLFFLGSPRLAGLVALTIPFSLLFALVMMYFTNIPIGLLSIGSIDFGIIVDGAVIMAENIASRLGHYQRFDSAKDVRKVILDAALEVQRPVFFAILMIIGVHLPLLTLVRIEGLLFRPMAITIVFALMGSLLFALFVVPALCAYFFRQGLREWENPFLRVSRWLYQHALRVLLPMRWVAAPLVLLVFGGVMVWLGQRLGTEFLPYLDEGVVWLRANFPEGTSLQQTATYANRIREIVREFPDIDFVSSRSGRTDSGLDPFPPSRIENMIGPKPREQWTQFDNKRDLLHALGERLRGEFPTTRFVITQPIIDNVTEETNGTSANLAVEYTGPDPAVLQELARKTVDLLQDIAGAQDVAIEQEGPQPQLVIEPDRALCARYNIRLEDVNTLVNTALGGDPVGNLYEGERVFDIAIKFDRAALRSPQAVGQLPVFTPDGQPVPLNQVARVEVVDGQTMIAREGSRRRITVRCDIVDRDQGSFVKEAQSRFATLIQLPTDYRVNWIGMYENLHRARKHFQVVGPITIGLVFVLLIFSLGSVRGALTVLSALPFAFVGGAVAIYLRAMNLNVSVGVGFAALFGVAIMDGILMVQFINNMRLRGLPLDDAIIRGASERLRPILMTSIVAMIGLMPASLATGLGSDVQRPLATVIVWGLFSSTAMTLFMVPVLYRILIPPLPKQSVIED
jgi:cobalt-zinc-cadmium resistance protein CzcA